MRSCSLNSATRALTLRVLGRYHRPIGLDPHGREAAEAIPSFELAPVGELLG